MARGAGPVVSDVTITTGDTPPSNHANASGVDAIVAFDLLVAAQDAGMTGARSERTVVVAEPFRLSITTSTGETPTDRSTS